MAGTQERIDFINRHKADVIEATAGTGLFPSVKMAQMILESADNLGRPGMGVTAVRAKNYFGIKADGSWKGAKLAFNTPNDAQPVSYFRVYSSAKDSVQDHSAFLIKNPRYANHGVFTALNPEQQALALEKAGYAEGSNYAGKLVNLINTYNLRSLDEEAKKKSKGAIS